jgi:hypothetical protein
MQCGRGGRARPPHPAAPNKECSDPMTETADLTISGQHHRIIDLPTEAGASLDRLPHILRIMLENVLRNAGEDARRPRPRS